MTKIFHIKIKRKMLYNNCLLSFFYMINKKGIFKKKFHLV